MTTDSEAEESQEEDTVKGLGFQRGFRFGVYGFRGSGFRGFGRLSVFYFLKFPGVILYYI